LVINPVAKINPYGYREFEQDITYNQSSWFIKVDEIQR